MTTRSSEDVVAIARLLGHADVQVFPQNGRWFADCACGWVGSGLVVQREAVLKAQHHIVSAVAAMDRFAHSHGISRADALSTMAVDPAEFEAIVAARIEDRESDW